MEIAIPAKLASGALLSGEQSESIAYLVARRIDRDASSRRGSGRVRREQLLRALQVMFSRKHAWRILDGEKATRYFRAEGEWIVLTSAMRVVDSFACEPLESSRQVWFRTDVLTTRQRRGAALLAAVLAGTSHPRSNAFLSRFGRVDRKTLGRWDRDPVIRVKILGKVPQWTHLSDAS